MSAPPFTISSEDSPKNAIDLIHRPNIRELPKDLSITAGGNGSFA